MKRISLGCCGLAAAVMLVVLPSVVFGQATYVGSSTCMACHKPIYETWKGTLHNRSQQELSATNDPVVVDWKGVVKLKAGNLPEATVRLSKGPNGEYLATLVDAKDPSKEKTYTVLRTYGGHGWKQRYHVKIGNNHYILPIQWNQATSRWVAYNLQNWYKEDGSLREPAMRASFDQDCAGCHNTGLQLKKVDSGYESSYVELNTGCERCHGPGSNHIKAPKTKGSIVNPKSLSYERSLEVCGQCHSRGVSQPSGTFGFPWNDKDNKPYIPGEVLANYYQFKPGMWPAAESTTFAHSRSHHQQWHDLLTSKHFAGKVTCQDCHNPHGGPGRFQMVRADFNNSLCLGCHGKDKRFSSPGAIMKHTKHAYSPEAQGLSRCSSCHMVKTASSAEGGDVHSHDFKIVRPAESLAMFKKDPKMVAPNSCNVCHRDWAKDEAGYGAGVGAYDSMFGKK
jgi:predicted CXXCH cytochrome family protein